MGRRWRCYGSMGCGSPGWSRYDLFRQCGHHLSQAVSVLETVYRANRKYAYNSGRGGYRESVQTAEKIFAVRDCLGRFFHCPEQNIVFANNCTTAVNTALKGLLSPGDHVLISALEHNAVFSTPSTSWPVRGVSPMIKCRITRTRTAFCRISGHWSSPIRRWWPCSMLPTCLGWCTRWGLSATTVAKGLALCGRLRPKRRHSAY